MSVRAKSLYTGVYVFSSQILMTQAFSFSQVQPGFLTRIGCYAN